MVLRFPRARDCLTAILFTMMMAGAPALALAQDPPATAPKKKLPEAPSKLPKVGADKTKGLDFLFGALKAAPDEDSAKPVEPRPCAICMQTPTTTPPRLILPPQST